MTPLRRPLHRAAAWLMAALFALIVGEPLRVHACPVHASLRGASAAGAAGDASQATAHDGASHDAHAAHAAQKASRPAANPHGGQHGDGHDAHPCDCLGTCSGVAVVKMPRTLVLHLVEVGIVEPAAWPVTPVPVARSGDHLLPFANGPPALA